MLSLVFLLPACASGERPSRGDGGGGVMDAGLVIDASGDVTDAAAADSGSAADAGGSADGGRTDGGASDASMGTDAASGDAGPCGTYGAECCGTSCVEGACLGGTCVAFGGVFAFQGEDTDECVPNPLAGGTCSCPAGFVDQALIDVDGNTDEGTGWETIIHVCRTSAEVPGADFRGASGERLAGVAACTASCSHPNAFTGDCSCPVATAQDTRLGVHYQAGTSDDCHRRLSFCRSLPTTPLTYGGTYRTMTDTGVTCLEIAPSDRCEANPVTGDCSCPSGFTPVVMRAYMPHKDPARLAANWFCRADLAICVRSP